jgi:hypothetical protein
MQVRDLLQRLEEFADAYGDDAEIRLAQQESWPFEYSIKGCVSNFELGREDDEHEVKDEDENRGHNDGEIESPIFYIVEGAQLGYFRKDAWDACY